MRSKVEQETELLQKFRALLNEKKSKIRQQQQELSRVRPSSQDGLSGVIESARGKSGVKVSKNQLDKDEEEEEEEDGGIKIGRIGGGRSTAGTAKKRTARVSRPGKRKATKDVSSDEDDDDNDGEPEKIDVDSPESEPEPSFKTMGQSSSSKTLDVEDDTDSNNDEDEAEEENGKISGRETPDRDDDETASEPDEMDETVEAGEKDLDVGGSPASPPPPSPSRLATRGKGHAASSKTTMTPQKNMTTAAPTAGKGKAKETPTKPTPVSHAKRAGATATRASQPAGAAAKTVDEGSETESDDEL